MKAPALLILVVLGGFAGACSRAKELTQSSTEVPAGQVWLTPKEIADKHIALDTIEDKPVGGAVRAAGRVTFDDLRVAHVFSPVSGKITQIQVDPGQRVKAGQSLCVIQSPDLGSAISDLEKARATLTATAKDWKRQKELYEAHAAAQRDYENAESAYLNAKAEMERAENKARLLRSKGLDFVTQEYNLHSPIDGEVIMRAANPGLEVQGQYSGGATLEIFTIGELDQVWVIADVFELDLPRIKKGADVSVTVLAYPELTFNGRVEWISGALDSISRTAKVRCSIANRDGKLRPEMFGTVRISVDQDLKLGLKRSALQRLGEQPIVYVETGTTANGLMRFERRPIAVDEMLDGDYVPVKNGVERGERVVVEGGAALTEML